MSGKKQRPRTLTEAELERLRNKRPENYSELPPDQRKKIDESLGLIDDKTGISLL